MLEVETVELENGNKVNFKKERRYGSWSVSFERGGIPDALAGKWQSLSALKAKTFAYLEQRPARNRTKPKEE